MAFMTLVLPGPVSLRLGKKTASIPSLSEILDHPLLQHCVILKSPWIASFGFGVRTVMLGYYMKFDFAKPIEDFEVGKMKFYLTLGHKF